MNLTDFKYVDSLVKSVRFVFETPQGKEVMAFLEEATGYNGSIFNPDNRDLVLINEGKRQVLCTLKTFMRLSPEQIVALAKEKENE